MDERFGKFIIRKVGRRETTYIPTENCFDFDYFESDTEYEFPEPWSQNMFNEIDRFVAGKEMTATERYF